MAHARMTVEEFKKQKVAKKSKFRNVKEVVDGITFDSAAKPVVSSGDADSIRRDRGAVRPSRSGGKVRDQGVPLRPNENDVDVSL